MGNNVLEVFKQFPNWHKLSNKEYKAMCNHINFVQSYKETWETIDKPLSKIVVAGSGMITGGRVLTYLQQLIDAESTTVLIIGFQAEGTRGRQLLDGAHELKFFGKYYPVKANIKHLESLSAHADQNELLSWLANIKNIPEKVFLVHGETSALESFSVKIKDTFGWKISIPKLFQTETVVL